MRIVSSVLVALSIVAALLGCAQKTPPAPLPPPPFKVVATSKQLMHAIVIPASDAVWAVGNEAPKDDAGWLMVENHALALAESANLLMMEGRAVDHENWMKQSKILLDGAVAAATAAHAKDGDKVLEAGDVIYGACEGCHMQYMSRTQ